MTNKYKEIISDLKLILQTDDLAQIKEMLNKIKDLNDSSLEEALLSGIKYTNTSDMADFENWMLVSNDIFKEERFVNFPISGDNSAICKLEKFNE